MTTTKHSPAPVRTWQLRGQNIELGKTHRTIVAELIALMAARAALVTEWRQALDAGDSERAREIERALEFKGAQL